MAGERDWPIGHPRAADYDPNSPEAAEWRKQNIHPAGQRDWPVGHPKAADTPGQSVVWAPGVDPQHPEREPFSGHAEKPAASSTLPAELDKYAQAGMLPATGDTPGK